MKFSAKKIDEIRRDAASIGVRAAARKHGCSAMYASEVARGVKRRKVTPLFIGHFETKTKQLWNSGFWYGDGEPATTQCVVLSADDYKFLRRSKETDGPRE